LAEGVASGPFSPLNAQSRKVGFANLAYEIASHSIAGIKPESFSSSLWEIRPTTLFAVPNPTAFLKEN